ncbi:MAG TPA: class I SAM-dependent methyltransferase [Planctomycetaceae bacterium]|nr:class I SAM-dependent methyltransferase [Planctomycetaceae bacterium]
MSDIPSPERALAERIDRENALTLTELSPDPASWERTTCRACLATELLEVLSLGDQPPANSFVKTEDLGKPEARFPLSLRLCEACGMVQLGHVVPPELLFRSYLFFTSSSQWMADHFSKLMTESAAEFVPPGGLVVEIGSNDGTALSSIQRRDVRLLGIDPARNISVMAASRGVPTIAEFFNETLAAEVARVAGQAHLIVACNVLGHINDLDHVCEGIQRLLAPGGAFVIEVPYLGQFLERNEYDTIYHEHLSYFAVRPLVTLMNRFGLRVERVRLFPVHGGTIRVTVQHGQGYSPEVSQWLEREEKARLADRFTFGVLAAQAARNRQLLMQRLTQLKHQGKKVIGYGAPAKGTVCLNYCGIGTDLLPAVLDSTPAKQGLHVPGTHQPILPPSALAEQNPDVLLLLAWNHADEIIAREHAFRERGGQFLTPRLEVPT